MTSLLKSEQQRYIANCRSLDLKQCNSGHTGSNSRNTLPAWRARFCDEGRRAERSLDNACSSWFHQTNPTRLKSLPVRV
jgi:hypothetical protein